MKRRFEMTLDRREAERERDRIRYKRRLDNMTPEQLAIYRENRRNYERQRRSNMTDAERSAQRETRRTRPIINDILTHIQSHAQSEVARFSGNQATINLNLDRSFLNFTIDNGQSNSTEALDIPFNPIEADHIHFDETSVINDIDNLCSSNFDQSTMTTETGHHDTPNRTRRVRTLERASHNCARGYIDCPEFRPLQLGSLSTCQHCQAKLFPTESKYMCCLNGSLKLPLIDAPPELMQLYTANSPEGIHFRQNIRAYNHVFAFTSMGVNIDERLANAMDGVYTYRAQGAIYHKIGSLLPQDGDRPRYLQMYIFDTDNEIDHRLEENNSLNPQVLTILKQILDTHNPYVQVLRQISQREDIQNIKLHIKELLPNERQYNMPTSSQVAAILIGEEDPLDRNDRDIIVQTSSGDLLNVPDTAGFFDPLQYPLLHPHGNFGWDLNVFNNYFHTISCRAYYSYLLQIRNNHDSLLLRSGRLFQQYVVDNYVKIATQRLRYFRDNQQKIRAELYQTLHHSVRAGETNTGEFGINISKKLAAIQDAFSHVLG